MKSNNLRSNIIRLAASIFVCITLIFGIFQNVKAEVDINASYPVDNDTWADWPHIDPIYGTTAILMDADTGTVLYSKGADAQRYPASITKVMTALLVAENVSMEDTLEIPEPALADAYEGSSNIAPVVGEVFSIPDSLKMLLVKSANDVATALAFKVSGSVEGFCDLMNARAAELGCTNTHFANANGLENPDHYTSARDMAYIMRAAIQYPVITETMGMTSIVIPATAFSGERVYYGHNYLIDPASEYYYPACVGGKTGYTDEARSTLVCYAANEYMRLIGVVMGAPETGTNASDMVQLFEYGFNNFYHADPFAGIPGGEGNIITLPNNLDISVISHTDTVENGLANIVFSHGEHIIDSRNVSEDVYNAFIEARGENTAGQNPQPIVTDSADSNYEAIKVPETVKDSDVQIVLYIIIAALIAAIILCVLVIRSRKNAARNTRKRSSGKTNNKK